MKIVQVFFVPKASSLNAVIIYALGDDGHMYFRDCEQHEWIMV